MYEIKLKNGYSVKCSKDHMVMTNKGWRKPLDLTSDDYIEQSEQYHKFSFGNGVSGLDEKTAWLMGMLVSEGCITHKNTNIVHKNKKNDLIFYLYKIK